jgi:hypothetical protein
MPEAPLEILLAELRELRQSVSGLGARLGAVEGRLEGLDGRLGAFAKALDDATGGGKITLALLGKQVAQVLQEPQMARAAQRVTDSLLGRLHVSVQGLGA